MCIRDSIKTNQAELQQLMMDIGKSAYNSSDSQKSDSDTVIDTESTQA